MHQVNIGPLQAPLDDGGAALGRPSCYRVLSVVLATGAILGLSVGFGAIVGLAFSWASGVSEAGAQPPGHFEALRTASLAVFLLAFQAASILFTMIAVLWFPPQHKQLLTIGWPKSGWKAILGALFLFIMLLATLSLVVTSTNPEVFANDTKPFADLMQARTWWLMLIAAGVGAPLAEELLFRGLVFGALRETRLGFLGAAILSSASWAVLHFQYSWMAIAMIVVMGLYFAWLREKTGSLLASMICHGLYNGLIVLALALTAESTLQLG